jgi:phosphatidylglycerol---prolipoprotein diacylglyceryl transferase
MQPVLFSVFGLDVQSYGVSKALAALLGAFLLGRAFDRLGLKRDDAHALVVWATVWGFVGAKAYYLLEHASTLTWHHFGGMGFTWYGGLIGGIIAALVVIRRRSLPALVVADAAAIPLTLAYGVGRVGCWLSGDGTCGRPTALPWGVALPNGVVPSDVPVHPTPLYEALAALLIAAVLWAVSRRQRPALTIFGAYLILSGLARLAVELLRINEPAVLGLTQPQLWSIVSIASGAAIVLAGRRGRRAAPDDVVPSGGSRAAGDGENALVGS